MNNTLKTFILMAALTALFMTGGGILGGKSGMMMAFLMAVGLNFFSYWNSDKLVLRMSGAKEVSPQEAPDLHQLVEDLAQKANLPKPKVYVINNPTPNAFATGRNPDHSAVAVTTGIMEALNREELGGVIAHELAHIKNRDILISSIAAVMAGAISSLATFAMFFGGSNDRKNSNPIVTIIMMMVAPIAASMIQMAISRSREYIADQTGAEICGKPKALASALNKLSNYNKQRPMDVNPATAQMYIVNPLSGKSMAKLFSTHPPMEERIRRLLSLQTL